MKRAAVWGMLLFACARPRAPSPPRIAPTNPWTVVLEGCAETAIASASGATIVLDGWGAARVDGSEWRPLSIPHPSRDLERIHVDDIVGAWPDRAWIVYSPSVGEDEGRFARIARVHADRIDPDAAVNVVATPHASLLVLEGDGTTLRANALTDAGMRPAPLELGETVATMQTSGVGLERLHDAAVLPNGTILIADTNELAIHRIAPGRAPVIDRFTVRGQVSTVDALPLVVKGSVVHAAFNVQLSPGLSTYLARFDGQTWSAIDPPTHEGEIDGFDVGEHLWVAAGGRLYRRRATWEVQRIDGRVVKVAAAGWAITDRGAVWRLDNDQWKETPLPPTRDGQRLFARRVYVRARDEVWLTATTDADDPDWPRTERTDALLRLGGPRPNIECSPFSAGRFFTQRAKAPSRRGRCNTLTFLPPLAGWMRPEDEPALREGVARVASATFERIETHVFAVTVPNDADARRLLREPSSAFGGWRPIAPEGCQP
jgi:hypothetical protein